MLSGLICVDLLIFNINISSSDINRKIAILKVQDIKFPILRSEV